MMFELHVKIVRNFKIDHSVSSENAEGMSMKYI